MQQIKIKKNRNVHLNSLLEFCAYYRQRGSTLKENTSKTRNSDNTSVEKKEKKKGSGVVCSERLTSEREAAVARGHRGNAGRASAEQFERESADDLAG